MVGTHLQWFYYIGHTFASFFYIEHTFALVLLYWAHIGIGFVILGTDIVQVTSKSLSLPHFPDLWVPFRLFGPFLEVLGGTLLSENSEQELEP